MSRDFYDHILWLTASNFTSCSYMYMQAGEAVKLSHYSGAQLQALT